MIGGINLCCLLNFLFDPDRFFQMMEFIIPDSALLLLFSAGEFRAANGIYSAMG
jgi:hypothetical protein